MRKTHARLVAALFILLFAQACDGCGDKGGEDEKAKAPVAGADAGVSAEVSAPPRLRMAFGIPLPPEGQIQHESEDLITWYTTMTAEELEEYYQGRLTDYEVIRDGLSIRIVGLRSGLGSAFGHHMGRIHMPVLIDFRPPRVDRAVASKRDLAGNETPAEAQPVPEDYFGGGKKGSPVTARLPSGELMAPGARWGEPYTPPKGSFYHRRKFKPNWGRPFGDWRAF